MNIPGTRAAKRGTRILAVALGAAVAIGLGIASIPPASAPATISAAKPKGVAAAPTAATPAKPVAMGTYPVSGYKAAASRLPSGLKSALKSDSDLGGAQYLADSAAAIQGVKVVDALKARGVDVLGSSISGTKLTVNVASKSQVASVKAVGATAVIGAPVRRDYSSTKFHAVDGTDSYGGEGYFFCGGAGDQIDHGCDGFRCSIGFNGYSVTTGAAQFATAGHCATVVPSGSETYQAYNPTCANNTGSCAGDGNETFLQGGENLWIDRTLGTYTGEGQYGGNDDYGIINTGASVQAHPSIATWGGSNTSKLTAKNVPPVGTEANPNASSGTNLPLAITGETEGIAGATMCKSGSTTGWTCGVIYDVDTEVNVSNENVNAIVASTCLLEGDSGGAAVIGTDAVGIDSGSSYAGEGESGYPCGDPATSADDENGNVSVFFPMMSAAGPYSVNGQVGSSWQLAVTVATPAVVSPAPGKLLANSGTLNGTLATPTPTTTVSLYLDGSNTPASTVSAASGSWSFPASLLSIGSHTYSLVARSGYSVGSTTTGSVRVYVAVPANIDGGAGDFNSDGSNDLIVRDSSGELWLYRGNGAGGLLSRVDLGSASGAWKNATDILPVGDFNGDGHPDLVVRDSSGALWLDAGNGSDGFAAPVHLADGWQSMTAIVAAEDFGGDGHDDLIARDAAGVLWLYPGTGTGLGNPTQLATGWQSMTSITGVGDFNLDGKADIVARDASGTLWLYPSTGTGLGAPVQLGAGWSGYTLAAAGDFNGDVFTDLIARDSSGTLWLYRGTGTGFLPRLQIATGFDSYLIGGDGSTISSGAPTPSAVSVGVDFNGDGDQDVIARDPSGNAYLYAGDGSTGFRAKTKIATGWSGLSEITPVGDFNGDGHADVIARDSAGTLWLYPGNGTGGFGSRTRIASGWQSMTALQSVGDVDGDGHTDLLARDASGNVWFYFGNGTGGFRGRSQVAQNWLGMTAIVGVGDFTLDGHPDVVARDSSGTLWLYPGNGSLGFGPRVSLGTGWNGYTLVGVGDFNGDGKQDLLARSANGVLWLWEGNGSNGWLTHVSVSNSFGSLLLAGDSTH